MRNIAEKLIANHFQFAQLDEILAQLGQHLIEQISKIADLILAFMLKMNIQITLFRRFSDCAQAFNRRGQSVRDPETQQQSKKAPIRRPPAFSI